MLVCGGKYRTEDKLKTDTTKTKDNPEKSNNTKHSKTKLAWFSRLVWHSARKRGRLIQQRFRAHTGLHWPYVTSIQLCDCTTVCNFLQL